MAAPNIETSTNPTQTGGNASGVVVGLEPTQTLGFYGDAGVVQPSITGATTNTSTVLNSVVTALADLGLVIDART